MPTIFFGGYAMKVGEHTQVVTRSAFHLHKTEQKSL